MLAGTPLSFWIAFFVIILGMLALDLGVLNRKEHVVSPKEALFFSVLWIGLALIFNAGIYIWQGPVPALEFLSAYLIEKSLSVDNLFVFVLLFGHMHVKAEQQHRVLFWGVLGALVMRGFFIFVGLALLEKFHFLMYVFGAILIVSGVRMAFADEDKDMDLEKKMTFRWARKLLPLSNKHHGSHFTVIENGKRVFTPLFLVLVMVEISDLIFAIDSVPAVFAVSKDPFIVFTSNIFAILGLRSLYFLLASAMDRLHLLHYGLAGILVFVGLKMLAESWYRIPTGTSLGIIGATLVISTVASLLTKPKKSH